MGDIKVESRLVEAQSLIEKIIDNVERVIVGKRQAVKLGLIALLSQGHLLIEDAPGVGKTIAARALGQSLGGSFKRIQCTPDLLPADVLGVSVYNPKSGDFTFREGPILSNILLVMRSTEPRLEPSRLCWKLWRRTRSV